MDDDVQDLTIIGGGIMGLFTAYYASRAGNKVTVLEQSYVGNPSTASFGLTRSYYCGYLDVDMALLAFEAQRLWREFEREHSVDVLVSCGTLNIAKANITPAIQITYARQAHAVMQEAGLRTSSWSSAQQRQRFPQFDADVSHYEPDAGNINVSKVTMALRSAIVERGVRIVEHADVQRVIKEGDGCLRIETGSDVVRARKIVLAAGPGTNDLLTRIDGVELQFPINRNSPKEKKYFVPPEHKAAQFTPEVFPDFAYLDIGIYGHPTHPGLTPGVKVSYYPPDSIVPSETQIDSVETFVAECIPSLQDAQVIDITDVDQCTYDMVEDNQFILGPITALEGVYVAGGFRGTGYKFGPLVGTIMSQLALTGETQYDVARFNPDRFKNGDTK